MLYQNSNSSPYYTVKKNRMKGDIICLQVVSFVANPASMDFNSGSVGNINEKWKDQRVVNEDAEELRSKN